MSQKFTPIFPGQRPTELKRDGFLGRYVLQDVDDWILREAQRWPDPWRFLLGVRRLPPVCYDLFRAAQSVSRAMNRMQNMLYGGATLQRDLVEEMQKRDRKGDEAGVNQIARKIIRAMLKHGLWRNDARAPQRDKSNAQLERWKAEAEAGLRKKYGRGFQQLRIPTAAELGATESLIIANWLRWGCCGEPGLCFYSDQAMADLLSEITGTRRRLHQKDGGLTYFRKLRQNLQLDHAFYRKPIVIRARKVPGTGQIEIELRGDDKPYRLTDRQRIEINGRQFYPILSSPL